MADLVFLGPTLPVDDARALLPDATFLPPVEHGDLLRLRPGRNDRVLVVDGLFFRKAPVRHREITALLDHGVTVAGSSSMGALRAAELHRYGMRGVGRVFRLYRDGVVTADDEVAVMHGAAEDGYRLLSEPLVNIRLSLADAVADGALGAGEAGTVLAAARALPFRSRSYAALRALTGPARVPAARFLRWRADHPGDAKAEDARLLLRMAAAGDPALSPASGHERPAHATTHFYRAWVPCHRGSEVDGRFVSDAQTAAAVTLLHPDLPAALRRQMVRIVAGADTGADAAAVSAPAVAALRRHGLLTGPVTDPVGRLAADTWLAPHEADLPAGERVLRTATRAFGVLHRHTMDHRTLPPEVADADTLRRYRRFVAAGMRLNERLPRPVAGRPDWRMHFRADVIDETFARLWCCPLDRLEAAVWDRGIADLARFREMAEPLTAAVKVLGPPGTDRATNTTVESTPATAHDRHPQHGRRPTTAGPTSPTGSADSRSARRRDRPVRPG